MSNYPTAYRKGAAVYGARAFGGAEAAPGGGWIRDLPPGLREKLFPSKPGKSVIPRVARKFLPRVFPRPYGIVLDAVLERADLAEQMMVGAFPAVDGYDGPDPNNMNGWEGPATCPSTTHNGDRIQYSNSNNYSYGNCLTNQGVGAGHGAWGAPLSGALAGRKRLWWGIRSGAGTGNTDFVYRFKRPGTGVLTPQRLTIAELPVRAKLATADPARMMGPPVVGPPRAAARLPPAAKREKPGPRERERKVRLQGRMGKWVRAAIEGSFEGLELLDLLNDALPWNFKAPKGATGHDKFKAILANWEQLSVPAILRGLVDNALEDAWIGAFGKMSKAQAIETGKAYGYSGAFKRITRASGDTWIPNLDLIFD